MPHFSLSCYRLLKPQIRIQTLPTIISRIPNRSRTEKMSKPNRPKSGRTNLASCAVATIFLIFAVIVGLVVFFTVFNPQNPNISVKSVNFPSFSVANTTVSFSFSQNAAVSNPNKDVFSHYDSSIQLLYSGSQVGFMFIPAGRIESGQTQHMAATFAAQSFPLAASPATMEIESRMEVAGRVRVLHFFSHHVEAKAACKVAVAVSDGSVLGFQC